MKQIQIFFAFALACVLLGGTARSQDQDHIFIVTTQKAFMPEGGRGAERDSLLQLYHDKVTKKNSHVISQRVMQHLYGSDNHHLVFITEYKDWASIDASTKMDTELFEKSWADEASRRQFNRMFGKYFSGHSDEIYSERTKLRK